MPEITPSITPSITPEITPQTEPTFAPVDIQPSVDFQEPVPAVATETQSFAPGISLDDSTSVDTKFDPNVFRDDNVTIDKSINPDEKKEFIGAYVRVFIISSITIILCVLLIALIFSYRLYIQQSSLPQINPNYATFVPKYQGYLKEFTSAIGQNFEGKYTPLPITTTGEEVNALAIINASDLSYAQKKQILNDKLASTPGSMVSEINEIETIKKDIAKFGFLSNEIKGILEKEDAISAIQRSLNSLEIIKFSTAAKVFSYLDSAALLIGNSIGRDATTIMDFLTTLSSRGEKDFNAYVYMCYLNPFEISQDCNVIGDFDLYYNNILQDKTFDISLFKSVMKSIDQILEQSEIPSFSILFNSFNAYQQTLDFNIQINTLQTDESMLILKGIKSPHVFILTNLINLLKQSVSILGSDIDTKTLDISPRTITVNSQQYNVNSSSKQFTLPIQKSSEREIFDYLDLDELVAEMKEDEREKEAEKAESLTGEDLLTEASLLTGGNLSSGEELALGEELLADNEMLAGDETLTEEEMGNEAGMGEVSTNERQTQGTSGTNL